MDSSKNKVQNSRWNKFSKSNLPYLVILIIQIPIFAHIYIQNNTLGYFPIWLPVLVAFLSLYFVWTRLKQSNNLIRILEAIIISALLGLTTMYFDTYISGLIGAFSYR